MSSNQAPLFNNAFGSDDILLNYSLSHTSFLLLNSSDLTKSLTPSQPINYFSPLNSLDTFPLPTQKSANFEPLSLINSFNQFNIQPEQTRTLSTTKDPITGMTVDAPFVNQAASDSLLNSNTTTPLITNNNIWAIKAEGTVIVNGSGDFDGAP